MSAASTLHTLNKSPLQSAESARLCCAALVAGDSLLLLEDGVHAALQNASAALQIPAGVQLFVLAEDLALRGISAKIQPGFSRITYPEFVTLCLAHARIVNWN